MPTTAASPRRNAPRRHVRLGLAAMLLVLTSSALPLQPNPNPLAGADRDLRKTLAVPCIARDHPVSMSRSLPQAELRSPAPRCEAAGLGHSGSSAWRPYAGLALALSLSAALALCCLLLSQRLTQQNQRLQRAEQALQRAAAHRVERDALTGLHSPATFQKQALQQIHRAERYGHPLSLVLLDIDAFKAINDNHGLRVGDGVLCSLARLLARNLRESDQLCRWGGEAFLVLIPHSDPQQALQLAQRLRSLLARNPLLVDRPITASFGVASLQPGEALSELLRLARRALLRAKATGRNRIECASTELDRPGGDPGKNMALG